YIPTRRSSDLLISSTNLFATSLMCTSPLFPSGNSTNAPKGLTPVTVPTTFSPTSTDMKLYILLNILLITTNHTIKLDNNHFSLSFSFLYCGCENMSYLLSHINKTTLAICLI